MTASKTGLTSYQKEWRWKGLLFIAPAVLVILFIVIYPLLSGIGYAFTNYNGYNPDYKYVGLYNFVSILTDDNFLLILKNTLVIALIYIVTLNILAIALSVLVLKVGKTFGNFVKSMLYVPCLLAMAIVGFIWKLIYNYNDGLLNDALCIFNSSLGQDWLGDRNLVLVSVSLAIVWYALGYYMVIYCAGLMAIPVELYEAAEIEGAGSWKSFRYVTLPLLSPSITINVVLSSMAILSCFDLPYVLTTRGGPGYFGTTIAISIYRFAYVSHEMGKAFSMSVILAVFSIIIAIIELRVLMKKEDI